MTESNDQASTAALSAMKLAQLQAIAGQLGLKGVSRLRKGELIEAIRAGATPQDAAKPPARTASSAEPPAREEPPATGGSAGSPAEAEGAAPRSAGASRRGATSRGRGRSKPIGSSPEAPTLDVLAEISTERSEDQDRATKPADQPSRGAGQAPARTAPGQRQSGQQNQQNQQGQQRQQPRQQRQGSGRSGNGPDEKLASLDDIIHFPDPQDREADQSRGGDGDADSERGGRRRRGRDRGRDRKRRSTPRETSGFEEDDIHEDDVLVPVAGILDVLDNYAFVRTTGYLPGTSDVYVNLGQVRKSGLRRGDAITGAVRQPREGENNHRQKFNALVRLDSINGTSVDESAPRPDFTDLVPIYPQRPLELGGGELGPRIIDLVSPIGLGQRALIHAPTASGRSTLLGQLAATVTEVAPQAHLMMVLLDERPEDVTLMERAVRGEVIASTFDRPAADHTTVAELAVERAKRLVELGQDVVVLLDSVTALARAYHASAQSNRSGPGLDVGAAHLAKKFFGAARKVENAGSLTMIATLTTGGTELEAQIAEAFTGTATAEITLDADLVAAGRFPAIDVHASATRRQEELFDLDELAHRQALARMLSDRPAPEALDWLTESLSTATNEAFLASIRVTPAEKAALRRSLSA